MLSATGRIALFLFLFSLSCTSDSSSVLEPITPLKHIVLLDLKKTCTAEEEDLVIARLNSLNRIEGVYDLAVSRRTETEDSRAIQNYDLMLSMEFESLEQLKVYTFDDHHLAIRKSLASYLDSAPRVIDSWE